MTRLSKQISPDYTINSIFVRQREQHALALPNQSLFLFALALNSKSVYLNQMWRNEMPCSHKHCVGTPPKEDPATVKVKHLALAREITLGTAQQFPKKHDWRALKKRQCFTNMTPEKDWTVAEHSPTQLISPVHWHNGKFPSCFTAVADAQWHVSRMLQGCCGYCLCLSIFPNRICSGFGLICRNLGLNLWMSVSWGWLSKERSMLFREKRITFFYFKHV